MNKRWLLLMGVLFFIKSSLLTGMGLILPMPTQDDLDSKTKKKKQTQPAQQQKRPNQNNRPSVNQGTRPQQQNRPAQHNSQKKDAINPDKIFIPLPKISKDPSTGQVKKTGELMPAVPATGARPARQPVAPRPQQQTQQPVGFDDEPFDYPVPNDEISVTSSQVKIPNLSADEPEIMGGAQGGEVVVYPKDTGSAIFMVMKSWKCDDYDAATLLEHAVGVYAQEADDGFEVKGLPTGVDAYDVTIEEEDITLDELLDLVAQQAGRDWGVDINNRSIYFYPPGLRSATYDLW